MKAIVGEGKVVVAWIVMLEGMVARELAYRTVEDETFSRTRRLLRLISSGAHRKSVVARGKSHCGSNLLPVLEMVLVLLFEQLGGHQSLPVVKRGC